MPDRNVEDIQMLILDADGVLTDGGLYYDHEGNESKKFNIRDGLGIRMWIGAGLKIGVITGRGGPALKKRVEELGIRHYAEGIKEKVPALRAMAAEAGVEPSQIAYMGDDLPDIPVFKIVGYAMAPDDAEWEVKLSTHYHARRPGGQGAVRDAVDWLLLRKGLTQRARRAAVPGLLPDPDPPAHDRAP